MDVAQLIPGLNAAENELAARGARVVTLKPGHKIFSPGQACTAFLLVKAGSVKVSTMTESGRELLLYRVGPGETCVLTTSCLLSASDYDAEGVPETETEAFMMPKAQFETLLAQSAAFRHFVFASFGSRLRDLIVLVQEVSHRHVDRRLARYLCERGATGPIAATHQEIAVELGTAREVVSRLLKHFAAEGLVRLERRQIVVADMPALGKFPGRL